MFRRKSNFGAKWLVPATACVVAVVCAGCGGSGSGSVAASTTKSSLGKQGISIAETTNPATLDPQTSPLEADNSELDLSYQCLMQTSLSGQLEPALATGYTESKNKLAYTFDLRRGVKFSDGEPLTSADVVFSYHRLWTVGSPTFRELYNNFDDGVVADGPYKVIFKLTAPNAGFPEVLGNPIVGACAILSKKAVQAGGVATKMVGTGPWEQVSYTPDVSLTMKRNPSYWGVKTKSPSLKMLFIPQASTQLADFRSGAVDIIAPPESEVSDLKSDSQATVKQVASASSPRLEFNVGAAPFNNVDVRRAVALAINRKALVEVAYDGAAIPSSFFPPGFSWEPSLTSLPNSTYNASEAKQLLKAAGYPNGVKITIQYITSYDFGTNALMAQIESELDAVGFKVTLVPEQTATWVQKTLTTYTDFTLGWNEAPYQVDPALYVVPFGFEYGKGRGGPIPPKLQSLLTTAFDASSTATFDRDLSVVERYEDGIVYPSLPLLALKNYVAYRNGLTGVTVPMSGATTYLTNVG